MEAGTHQYRPRHRTPLGRLSAGVTLGATRRYRRVVPFDALPTRIVRRRFVGGPQVRVSRLPRSGVGQVTQIIGVALGAVTTAITLAMRIEADRRRRHHEEQAIERAAQERAAAVRAEQERLAAEAQAALVPVYAGSATNGVPAPVTRPTAPAVGTGTMLAAGVGLLALLAGR